MIAAVMCDMDGLLLDTERVCLETFLEVGAGLELLDPASLHDIFYQCVGLRSADSRKVLDRTIGQHIQRSQFDAAWDAAIDKRLMDGVPVKPGAKALLSTCHAQGIPVGVATSTQTDRAEHHLEQAGLLGFLTTVVGGDQVKNGKPDPETYLTLAARLGQDVQRSAAFEDSNTGTLAAVQSGAKVVQVPDLVPPSEATVRLGHHIAKDLVSGAAFLGLSVR